VQSISLPDEGAGAGAGAGTGSIAAGRAVCVAGCAAGRFPNNAFLWESVNA
jgi:hypothetical protein